MPKLLWNLYARCYDRITGLLPYQEMLDEVVAALELKPGMRVLDAGCGTGALAERLAPGIPRSSSWPPTCRRPCWRGRGRDGPGRRRSPSSSGNIDDVLAMTSADSTASSA